MKVCSFPTLILVAVSALCSFSAADATAPPSSSDVFQFDFPKPGAVYDYNDVVWSHVQGQEGKDAELLRNNATVTLYVQRLPTAGLKGNSLKLYDPNYSQLSGPIGFYFSPPQRNVVTNPRKPKTPFRMRATFELNGKKEHVDSPTFFITRGN